MPAVELIPFGSDAQRALEREWLTTIRERAATGAVRSVVRSSWERSLGALVSPDLPAAPVVLDEGSLIGTVEAADWLDLARRAVAEHDRSFAGEGHILSLFDSAARMLTAEGDPGALEGLAEINFRPGALWSEQAVGTNGPGTALATGVATHIVGAEHFCARWQRWHCAAVPVRDLASGQILGVVDISGFRERAHPHTLNLALALALAIEQSVAAREIGRHYLAVTRMTQLSHRYPADAALAVDRHGRVLLASPSAPAELSPERAHPALRALVPDLVGRTRDSLPREVEVALAPEDTRRGVWHPVFDGRTVVGGCLVLENRETGGPRMAKHAARLGPVRHSFADLAGESPALVAARDTALAAAGTDLPVLLVGEPGTGKEAFAQAIHQASDRRDRPLVAVDCGALSRDQAQRELLGSPTGIGRLEAADEGTLFLDEIGALPPAAQAVLLRVLEVGELTRVGETQSRPVHLRVIGATRRDLPAAVASGQLRPELYYRLNVMTVELPALRDRGPDLALLAHRFFQATARDLGRPEIVVEGEVFTAFQAYGWPGNLQELKNVVRRLMVMAGTRVALADLPQAIRSAWLGGAPASRPGPAVPGGPGRPSHIDEEDARLMDVVNRCRTMAEAAATLGITRSTLYRRMERFGLRPKRVVEHG